MNIFEGDYILENILGVTHLGQTNNCKSPDSSGVDLISSIFECLSRKTAEGSNVMVV